MSTEQKKAKLAEYRKESPRCSFIKLNGKRCKGIASKSTGMCPSHSGFIPQLQRKGVNLAVSNDLVSLKKYLCQLAMDIRRGRVKPQVGNAVKNAVDSVVMLEDKLVMHDKLEQMTKALEQYQELGIENAELASLELEDEYKEPNNEQ